jgi:Uma2 family endonuclease
VLATGLGTYPDVTVICGEVQPDPKDPNALVNPILLVEVLSDSSENYDRTEKYDQYRQISSLREYVLVSHRERLIEVFRRTDNGEWIRSEARTKSAASLKSIGCQLDVDRIYTGIEIPARS